MTKQEAVAAIIQYNTLPPQIDYTKPYERKAEIASTYLDGLPEKERDEAYEEIEWQTNLYYTPGECGHSPAELDAMF